MPNEISTVQSLRAVDAWIDVINANINGAVRTAFKSSRLKFGGTNTNIVRGGTTTSLPLQFPEPGLVTANSVIDFTQGAITASTENSHLALQGDGWFLLVDPASVNADGSLAAATANTRILVTRDGEFHTNQNGLLVNSQGYYLLTCGFGGGGLIYTNVNFGLLIQMRCVYNDLDISSVAAVATKSVRLSDYVANPQLLPATTILADGVTPLGITTRPVLNVTGDLQQLQFSSFGSTIYEVGYSFTTGKFRNGQLTPGGPAAATVLNKSLEASNASMTQSVPELSLAQKLFSALTKILQTSQTNTDSVLNLVR